MSAEPVTTRAPASVSRTACRSAVAAVTVISALFCVVVIVLLLVDQARLAQGDPRYATGLQELRLRFVEAPQDESLIQAIRLEDCRVRQRYFAARQRVGTGGWLLLGGGLLLLVSLAVGSQLREPDPDISRLGAERDEWARRRAARLGLAAGALLLLVTVVAVVGFAWRAAPDPLPILAVPSESPTPTPASEP